MTSFHARWMLGLAMLWGVFAPATLFASAIEDRAGFFSQEAIRDADVKLAGVQKQHNAELRIETYSGVPDDQKANLAAMNPEQRSKYFLTWLQRRAGEIHARGVLVLICKEPAHLEVGSGAEFRKRGFTDKQRAEITGHLMTSFKAKKYDEGLRKLVDDFTNDAAQLKAVGAVSQSTSNHAQSPGYVPPVGRHQQGVGNMSWLWTVGLIFLAVWIISALFRGVAHAGSGMMGGGAGMPMGGGTFGGGFLSGLFGSMAGMWMYDSLFRNHAYGSGMGMGGGYNDPGAMNTWNDSPVGTNDGSDFQSSGGDFGSDDNAGGGFFGGGGDSGGFADFGGGGGGDFGGGGGDFGGGGGEFG